MYLKRLITYSILSVTMVAGFFGSIHIERDHQSDQIVSISYDGNGVFAAVCTAGQTPAANGCEAPTPTEASKMYNSLINGMNIILWVITVIVSPAIMFAGWLMSPDWTSGDLFGLRAPMYALWVTVSNIVYFVYAILLILIALGTMFGKESFSYKVMLPKLALGILMVPFTWWFVQWTISLSAVVTASVITIPAETMKTDGSSTSSWWNTESIPNKIVISESSSGTLKQDKIICPTNCKTPGDFLKNSAGMYGYMMVYAYSIFKFQEVKQLNTVTDIIKEGVGIVHQWIIAAIMFLVFGLLTLALVAMLLVRAIKLWVYAIFSPLFTFQFVAGSAMMGENKDTFTIKEFVGLCFVPAIVGLALSFGLIMISAVSSGTPNAGNTTGQCTADKLKTDEWCLLANLMGNPQNNITRKILYANEPLKATTINTIKFGGIEMEFLGKAGASQDSAESANTTTGVLNSAGGIFGTLIIDIIALVFIWLAFMAAKNVSKAVSMAVEPFEKIGKQVGSLASSIPKYTPIPGLGMSMSGMEKGIGKVEQWFKDNRANKDAASPLGQLLGLEAAARKETVKAIENVRTAPKESMNSNLVGEALKQASLETKWNKAEKTAELMNTVLEKYAIKKDGKVTWFEPDVRKHLEAMNVKDNDYKKIIEIYKDKWPITKNYLENEGNYVYKNIHPNTSTGETPKTSIAESTEGSGKPITPEPAKPNPTTPPPKP